MALLRVDAGPMLSRGDDERQAGGAERAQRVDDDPVPGLTSGDNATASQDAPG